ncbi:hypothetical protein [Myxacorys almedinensis]|uniref:Uncharacterized protein n=1 Tax=Myxacorys almedinensis A TaxID=2690445 RepID=A0A8J7Z1N3_9CYAN|nr:hypothetical protein [Myxacorys almedinensis]NDJ18702.1 hypothetical protein [Myxacorys almedinensis A]
MFNGVEIIKEIDDRGITNRPRRLKGGRDRSLRAIKGDRVSSTANL